MRPTPLHQRFTPKPLALAAMIAIALAAGHAPLARAQSGAAAAAATPIAINIPAQPLGQALNELARQANLQMTFPAALMAGKQAPAVSGQLTARQALDRLLVGSGLMAVVQGAGVMVQAAPAPSPTAQAEVTLPAVRVTAPPESLTSPKATVGVLGERPVLDTPFTISSYTRQLIEQQQAVTLNDVVRNDPGVTALTDSAGRSFNSTQGLCGFRASTDVFLYDGLAGIGDVVGLNKYPLNALERIDVLKGPSAFLTGADPFASIGGHARVPVRHVTGAQNGASRR